MSKEIDADIYSVSETARSRDGVGVLEVSLMIQVSEKVRQEFKADVYAHEVELKSDPSDANLHPDELKDLMAGAAHRWEQAFGDWDATILSRDEPVEQ